YVDVPTIGKIEVLGKTLADAKKTVEEKALQYIKKVTVDVKLISFRITVLGEVNRPGVYYNYNTQLTVMEAIGMAGDITDYGKRSKVLVLRPTKEGTQSFSIDLTDAAILQSDGFFLLPNDMVYVEPIKSKLFIINAPTYGLFLSSITTLVLILNFVNRSK
ncbi:polysaccharide biosynthesis/export family protein, partial [Bacteroidota bacterium]